MEESNDLSQKTVVVLVVLTVLISVFGTFAVLLESNNIKTQVGVKTEGAASGEVKFQVINPNDKTTSAESLATGKVAFIVEKPK